MPPTKRAKISAQCVHNRGSGQVFSFGKGECGQLGLGPEVKKRNYPCLVDIGGEKVVQIAAGGMHTVLLDDAGDVWTFGVNDDLALGRETEEEEDGFIPGKVKLPKKAVQISAGDSHSAILTEDGEVHAWGTFKDMNGNLGLVPGNGARCRATPQLLDISSSLMGLKILKISSGDNHLAMLGDDGKIYTCGTGEQGQLGRTQNKMEGRITRARSAQSMMENTTISPRDYLLTPSEVKIPRKKFKDIWTGSFSTYCRTERNNEIWVFGLNNYDQLGMKDQQVVAVPKKSTGFKGKKMTQIAAGLHHAVALDEDGKVYTFGRGDDGRLGLGEDADQSVADPTLVPELTDKKCIQVAAGLSTTYALTSDGKLYAWGFGDNFQLGTGTTDDLFEPQPLQHMVLEGKKRDFEGKVKYVSGGGQHAAIILDRSIPNGKVKNGRK